MSGNITIYIAVMAAFTYLVRFLPIALIRGKINNPFIQSFLYYVPYVTLSVMTFPAILEATQKPLAGAAALGVGIVAAWKGVSMVLVAVLCCVTVLVLELVI
jgi:branched-subunit amino acid transport protein